ncbi:hypothetical protein CHS0354_007079 [Potamilus streckersoni]|uniref:Uncharacterized protein n=1 Tax=Potamilus streckersoni TaxID=2493646 RepID=A0AAE0RYI7_9BIVA|nr:hypothetical protein CHS0354_007079 [Potamilus streckersoni]
MCECYSGNESSQPSSPSSRIENESLGYILLDNERQTVENLLFYFEKVGSQNLIEQDDAIPFLHQAMISKNPKTKTAVMGYIRNLSLNKINQARLTDIDILHHISTILSDHTNLEAQKHAAGTVRNLALGDHCRVIVEKPFLERLAAVVLFGETNVTVLAEVTAILAVLAEDDEVKYKLIEIHDGQLFCKLVTLASFSSHNEVQYNSAGILAQMAMIVIPNRIKQSNIHGIVLYIDKFLKTSDPNLVHIALWTLFQHMKDKVFLEAFRDHGIGSVVSDIAESHDESATCELAQCVMRYLKGDESASGSN